ncbi:hypothetical protein N9414_12543 [Nodularia spumigena CCY9414]|nr:hypothetical protein N9414_12543 [Nodularia spumigena CCY9414]
MCQLENLIQGNPLQNSEKAQNQNLLTFVRAYCNMPLLTFVISAFFCTQKNRRAVSPA